VSQRQSKHETLIFIRFPTLSDEKKLINSLSNWKRLWDEKEPWHGLSLTKSFCRIYRHCPYIMREQDSTLLCGLG
jgi:hypothetical protein